MKPVFIHANDENVLCFDYQGIHWEIDPNGFFCPDHGANVPQVEELLEGFKEHILALDDFEPEDFPDQLLAKLPHMTPYDKHRLFIVEQGNQNRLQLQEWVNVGPAFVGTSPNHKQVVYLYTPGIVALRSLYQEQAMKYFYFPMEHVPGQ